MNRKFRVVVGPYQAARRWAVKQGLHEDEIVIVTRGHQLAALDPALILQIIAVKIHQLGEKILDEIRLEVDRVRALWPVETVLGA